LISEVNDGGKVDGRKEVLGMKDTIE